MHVELQSSQCLGPEVLSEQPLPSTMLLQRPAVLRLSALA